MRLKGWKRLGPSRPIHLPDSGGGWRPGNLGPQGAQAGGDGDTKVPEGEGQGTLGPLRAGAPETTRGRGLGVGRLDSKGAGAGLLGPRGVSQECSLRIGTGQDPPRTSVAHTWSCRPGGGGQGVGEGGRKG